MQHADARKTIRKESNNIYNRLHSLLEDAEFVSRVKCSYSKFRIYPNLRCGAWYVDPAIADPNPVYFKSTDGHFGQWAFNLRRLNLHLLESIIHDGGILIVDSTRQGKRLPDALAKTIPIWCAVVNRTVLKISDNLPSKSQTEVEWGLYTPPGSVSRSEHSQIERRLDYWVQLLLDSEFTLPPIRKPLRPIWITPETEVFPSLESTEFYSVICISASKLVSKGLERRIAGYTYVQGSGDDHELWGFGLTPDIYWKHKDQLSSCSPKELKNMIHALVNANNDRCPAKIIFPVRAVQSRILVGVIPISYPLISGIGHILITCLSNVETLHPDRLLHMESLFNKKGQAHFLTDILPQSVAYLKTNLDHNRNMAILCQDGKNLSVGIALTVLTLFFDANGNFVQETQSKETPTKSIIQKRLQWILADNPFANPARSTLKRVNEYLMTQPRHLNAAGAAVK